MFGIDLFSPAQLVGYGALLLGVIAFLQKKDKRLKSLISIQACCYCLHYFLLGNFGAAAAACITSIRSAASLYTRRPIIAHFFVALYFIAGYCVADGYAGWLPVIGYSIGTYAFFLLEGVAMRLLILSASSMMLAANVLSGSIGGTILETIVLSANMTTIVRMVHAQRAALHSAPLSDD